jgi:peptidoglycan/xylan/chitin deacetylase (PgdA/CDA1 family)
MATPKQVSLTFDNGPDPAATPDVLATLAGHGVLATFFVVGRNVESSEGRDLARRAREEGHRIGNHTFSHGKPFGALPDPATAIDEVERAQSLIESVPGLVDPDRLFRPNGDGGGRLNSKVMSATALRHLRAGGYTCVLWNSVPEDWLDPEGWAARALADVDRIAWPVVVVHDLPTGAMKNLESFILGVRDLGADFTLEFPSDCVPLLRGEIQWNMAQLMTMR